MPRTVGAATVRTTMDTLARTRAALSARPLVVDTAIALFLLALSLLAYVGAAPYVGPLSGVTLAFLLLESLPLIVRRRYPLAVLAVIAGASIVQLGLLPAGQSPTAGLGILVAVYTVGERVDRRTSLTATALTAALLAIVFVGRAGIAEVALTLIQTELILVVAWLLGDATRIRRLYAGRWRSAPSDSSESATSGPSAPCARSGSGSPASCMMWSRTT